MQGAATSPRAEERKELEGRMNFKLESSQGREEGWTGKVCLQPTKRCFRKLPMGVLVSLSRW